MKNYLKVVAVMLMCFAGLNNIGFSQSSYKIQGTQAVEMKLKGTSSLHDWEMNAKSATGAAKFTLKSEKELVSLQALSFALEVTNLKSEKKGLDKNAYKALKSDKFKDIRYTLTSATLLPGKDGYLFKTKGKLTVAGTTKEISMNIYCIVNADGSITCKGSYKLNMTDYNVTPPSFMGAMKTGNAISLDFKVIYKK